MDKPRVIIFVEGGVVQSVRANMPVDVNVWDIDNIEQEDKRSTLYKATIALQNEYNNLPYEVY